MGQEEILKRVMPHSYEAEQSVLGSMLMDRDAVAVAAASLAKEDFYVSQHAVFFESIVELYNGGKPVDLITVQDKLKEKDVPPEVQSLDFVKEIVSYVPTSSNIKAYCSIVKEKAMLRRFIHTAQEIENACYAGNKSADEIAEDTEKAVFEVLLKNDDKDPVSVREAAEIALTKVEENSKIEGNITGIPTGYKKLDELTGGLQRGELVILAARPSMGKTAFALNILKNVAFKAKRPAIMFSLEMGTNSLMNRFLSMESKVETTKLRNGKLTDDEWESLVKSVINVSQGNLKIDDTGALTVNEIRSKCRKEKVKGGLDLIVIDYLQLMSGGKKAPENRQQEITEISRGLKALAKEMDCPVIALSQLSRAPEARQDHRPMLADLRESGSIEQDADVVMFLYRDDYYTKAESEKPGETDVIIAKQRNGALDDVTLHFKPETTSFYETVPNTTA